MYYVHREKSTVYKDRYDRDRLSIIRSKHVKRRFRVPAIKGFKLTQLDHSLTDMKASCNRVSFAIYMNKGGATLQPIKSV